MKIPPPLTAEITPEYPPPNPRNKKTRDLPNLSDCNCCNRRINSTNPKNRLGILTSNWRIILLCKSCYNLVESSQFCSYCLARVSTEFYDCRNCRRRIHKDCVSRFSIGLTGNCDDFSVCFDCWIPNLVENEYNRSRAIRIGNSKKELGKNGVELSSLECSGLCNLQERKEKAVRIGGSKKELGKNGVELSSLACSGLCNLQEEVVMKENGFMKVMAGCNCGSAVRIGTSKKELGKNGVELSSLVCSGLCNLQEKAVEKKEKAVTEVMARNKGVEVSSETGGGSVVDEDAQLAIRLHREINSSPRITRTVCSVNTSCVESRGRNETSCSGRELNVKTGVNGVEMGSFFSRKRDSDSKNCLITYIRRRNVSKVVKCNKWSGSPLKVYSRKPSCMKQKAGVFPLHVVKRERGQCSKTYSRRRLKCKSNLVNNSLNLEN